MPYTLSPWFLQQFFDDDGNPLAFGKIASYLAGTSTPQATYSDATGTTNTNPTILDAAGRGIFYLGPYSYKMAVTDAQDVPIGSSPYDPVTSVAVTASDQLGSFFYFGGNSSVGITNDTYPSGADTDTLHAGTSIYSLNSVTLPVGGVFKLQAMASCLTFGTVDVALVNLDDGSPDTPIATASILCDAKPVLGTSTAITFATPGVVKNYGIKVKATATMTGFAYGIQLVRTA